MSFNDFVFYILSLMVLLGAFLVIFIYSSHKDYVDRNTLDQYKPKVYKANGFDKEYKKYLLTNEKSVDNLDVSLIFPAYNEEKRLKRALDKTISYFSKSKLKYEIIMVDDGSKDKTFDLIKSEIEQNKLVNLIGVTYDKNGGKGYAVKTGIQFARGEFILMLDSDGATEISDFEKLLKNVKSTNGLAIGSRKIISEKVERKWYRNILGVVNNFIVRTLIGIKDIKDTQCGFKLFSRKAAQKIFSTLHLVRWAFDVEMIYIAQHSNITVSEIPVTWTEIEGSKLVFIPATMSFFRDYFALITYYNLGIWKIASEALHLD